ncbi:MULTISPECIES: NAD-dependent epimerase/dehydratase family protein [Marinomonas]|uniref:NAD-dependent epimerase/dehydratase family protein n=1 Tax=Marinomonas rhodophyticola TaxID=2992803 RepID=A0ABT3KKH4_9GAMM|nr:NAD-dependent epimerase/dehydratase family protein [Marinomonas sp. KJ51-3]
MRRVLVTGSNGFTGRYVVTELKRRGYDVVEIVRKKTQLIKLNVIYLIKPT